MAGVTSRSSWVPLWVHSNYSFLTGASHPDELVQAAVDLGLTGMAITDTDSLAGIVQAREAAVRAGAVSGKEDPAHPFRFIVGARISVVNGPSESRPAGVSPSVLLFPMDREGYGNLGELISLGRLRGPKGYAGVTVDEIVSAAGGLALILTEESVGFGPSAIPSPIPSPIPASGPIHTEKLLAAFTGRVWVGISRHFRPDEGEREAVLLDMAERRAVPVAAVPRVMYHTTGRRRLQDALTCIRHGVTIDEGGHRLLPNGSFGLVSAETMARRYEDHPEWLDETRRIAGQLNFDLSMVEYRYPGVRDRNGVALEGQKERDVLRRRVRAGAHSRYPRGVPGDVSAQLEKELSLIEELRYGGYFLTMAEIVDFCRSRGILCQGRGSAANSAVCFCLGITAVDPVKMKLLFERFISRERAEPPDIDLDIEHRRREEVIQFVYHRYGRDHAAMVANTVRFRKRSALRELGKVFGFSDVSLDQAARQVGHHGYPLREALEASGFDMAGHRAIQFAGLVEEILDTPRHLSIHPGGFLLGREPVARIVPLENGAMEGRTVIQWDKYAVEGMNLFKLDLLGLGALTHLDYAFRLMAEHLGVDLSMALIPPDCSRTFAMLHRADTVGVFQLESRAQMAMLPRLRPKEFYDLVIQISIVRPGPITGGMVHPYLRRRRGEEAVTYPHDSLKPILERTLGVPLFQEQVMKLAIVAARYTPGEADQLRRDMAAWRHTGRIEQHHHRITGRMVENGIDEAFAEQIFEQIRGFGEYGFPESHAASFALIAYATAWVRAHYPTVFTCALLNAWPMGFYSPSTIVHDALRTGVAVRPVDILSSRWDCTLEDRSDLRFDGPPGSSDHPPDGDGHLAVRLGFRFVSGLGEPDWERIRRAREAVSLRRDNAGDLRAFLDFLGFRRDRAMRLAEAGAFDSLGMNRRQAVWLAMDGAGRGDPSSALPLVSTPDGLPRFAHLNEFERLVWDYRATGHSTRSHPLEPYREWLVRRAYPSAEEIHRLQDGITASYVGMVICRQRPSTARGTVFMTLEDETGFVNLIIWRRRYDSMRPVLLTASILGVRGKIQQSEGAVHLVVDSVWKPDLPHRSANSGSRDFR
jgi:error-prone DNA polymerase